MKEQIQIKPLSIPALRAQMGDWVYYIGLLKLRDVSERISIAEDIHKSKLLRDLLQRGLSNRSKEIASYLMTQKQRFFNALVVGTYGGNPNWHEIALRGSEPGELFAGYTDGVLGILELDGTEVLFAIDGQHRVAGIKKALEDESELGDEEVAVIFVSGITQTNREKDPVGFERTRRLFTTLNRYAKPVSKKDIIALDEDDIVAIITRQLVEEYELFKDKISIKQPKSIPPSDEVSFTTIIALYDVNDDILGMHKSNWKAYKSKRPIDKDIEDQYNQILIFWGLFEKYFPVLQELKGSTPTGKIPSKYRNMEGGHLLFRPVGLLMCVKVIKNFIKEDKSIEEAIELVSKAPMTVSEMPWVGLLWDPINKRMLTAQENQKAALKLLFIALGGNPRTIRTNKNDLERELKGLYKIENYRIPTFID